MADEHFEIKAVRQIIPSSGLWLRVEPASPEKAEFEPIAAIASSILHRPRGRIFSIKDCCL